MCVCVCRVCFLFAERSLFLKLNETKRWIFANMVFENLRPKKKKNKKIIFIIVYTLIYNNKITPNKITNIYIKKRFFFCFWHKWLARLREDSGDGFSLKASRVNEWENRIANAPTKRRWYIVESYIRMQYRISVWKFSKIIHQNTHSNKLLISYTQYLIQLKEASEKMFPFDFEYFYLVFLSSSIYILWLIVIMNQTKFKLKFTGKIWKKCGIKNISLLSFLFFFSVCVYFINRIQQCLVLPLIIMKLNVNFIVFIFFNFFHYFFLLFYKVMLKM